MRDGYGQWLKRDVPTAETMGQLSRPENGQHAFPSAHQQRYLKIVLGLAQQRGITLAEDHLSEGALRWERQHSGRSGRVARQFIDDLEADLKKDTV